MATTATMTRKTYALLIIGLLLVPLPGVLLATSNVKASPKPRDFMSVEVEVYKNNELFLRDYTDPVNAYWLETMIGSLFFSAIKYIYGYYSIDGHYLVNGIPMTTAETLTLGGGNISNITNYGWLMISPGYIIPLLIEEIGYWGYGNVEVNGSLSSLDDEAYANTLLSLYSLGGWCQYDSIKIPVLLSENSLGSTDLYFSLPTEPLQDMVYYITFGNKFSDTRYESIVLPINLLEIWLSMYLSELFLEVRGLNVTNVLLNSSYTNYNSITSRACHLFPLLALNLTRIIQGPIIALVGHSQSTLSPSVENIKSISVLYPSLGIIDGFPSLSNMIRVSVGFPGIGVYPSGGSGGGGGIIAQEGPSINATMVSNKVNRVVRFSIVWEPFLPQLRDNRLSYIYDVAGMILSQIYQSINPNTDKIAQQLLSTELRGGASLLPYFAFALNTTHIVVGYDEVHHSYVITIEAKGKLPSTYPAYNVFALELLSPYLVVGSDLFPDYMIEDNIPSSELTTNVPPVAIDFPNKYLVLYPGDEVKVVYRIKIKQDWPWTKNFYSYLIDYGIGVKWYYVVHNESLPTLLKFIDNKGRYHDSLFNVTRQEIPIPIPLIELSKEQITPQTFDTYSAYSLPGSLGIFESPASTLVLYKDNNLIRIAATLGLEVSNVTSPTSLARSIGVYVSPYSDTRFLFAAIPIQEVKLVSESGRNIRSNQYLYSMTIWLGVDLER